VQSSSQKGIRSS
jgi:hypothetical protein